MSMKTVNVKFDYEEKHYNFSAKFKWHNGKPELTTHQCNKDMGLDDEENRRYVIYDCNTGVEVITDMDMSEIENIILWDMNDPDQPAIAMWGELDNLKMEIKGLW